MNKKVVFWISVAIIVASFILLGKSVSLGYDTLPSFNYEDDFTTWLLLNVTKYLLFAFESFIIGIVLLIYSLFKKD